MEYLEESINEKTLEEKLFELVLILSIGTGLFWMIYRIIFFKSVSILIVNGLSTLFFVVIYVLYKTKVSFREVSLYYYFPILILVTLGYFPSGGAGGSVIAIATTIYCTGLIIIRPRFFMLYSSFFTILIFCLGAVEFIFPELSEQFNNERDKIRVSMIGNTMMFATLGFCIYFFRKEYVFKERRKQRLNEKLIREKNQIASSEKNKSIFLTSVWQEMIPSVLNVNRILERLKTTGLNEEQYMLISKLSKNNEFLTNLLSDFSEIAETTNYEVLLRNTHFELDSEIRELIELLESSPVHNDGLFTFKYSKRIPPKLIGDPIRIRQAIGSLLKNSSSFIKGKKVTIEASLVSARQTDCLIGFKLNYTGAGVSKQNNASLFEGFYNHDNLSKSEGEKVDPGMKIAKKLIQAMGGTIQFNYDENDFNFYFDLPFKIPENETN